MTHERLAEIREHDAQYDGVPVGRNSGEQHRHELRAEVDRLNERVAELEGGAEQQSRLIKSQHERICELEELGTERYADKLVEEMRLRSLEIRGGHFEMDLAEAHEMAAAYVAFARTMLGDAENYTETPIGFPTAKTEFDVKIAESPADWYVLTVQRKWKLTPHEARLRAEAERDEARQIARMFARDNGYVRSAALCRAKLEMDALPDWLTAEPTEQPHHGPHRGQGDDESAAATTNQRNTQNKPQNHATNHGGQP